MQWLKVIKGEKKLNGESDRKVLYKLFLTQAKNKSKEVIVTGTKVGFY